MQSWFESGDCFNYSFNVKANAVSIYLALVGIMNKDADSLFRINSYTFTQSIGLGWSCWRNFVIATRRETFCPDLLTVFRNNQENAIGRKVSNFISQKTVDTDWVFGNRISDSLLYDDRFFSLYTFRGSIQYDETKVCMAVGKRAWRILEYQGSLYKVVWKKSKIF